MPLREPTILRDATEPDLPKVAELYDAVVADTHHSFELEPPGLDSWVPVAHSEQF